MEEPRTADSQYDVDHTDASQNDAAQYDISRYDAAQQPTRDVDTADTADTAATGADVPQAPLATGQAMDVHPANLAAAKDALAAQNAAERAVAEHGQDANINPEEFRSVALPRDATATPDTATPDEP